MLITLPNSCWLNPLPSMWSCLTFFSEGISKFPSLLQPGPVQNFFSLKSFMSATFPKLKRILRPRPPVSEYFWIRNFGSRQHVSDESGIRIRNFFNPLSRVEIFGICYEPGTRVDAAKSGYFFLSRDVTRLSTILFRVRNIQDGAERNVIASLRLGLQFHVL